MEEFEELVERLGRLLTERRLKVVTVESCTGGLLGQCMTSVPGSSEWYERGFITYSNASKMDLVEVSPEVISRYGAVSDAVANGMARGGLRNSNADIAVAITGIAGPEGGSREKPIGSVWLSWSVESGIERTQRFIFDGDREMVRHQSVVQALLGLIRLIEEDLFKT